MKHLRKIQSINLIIDEIKYQIIVNIHVKMLLNLICWMINIYE